MFTVFRIRNCESNKVFIGSTEQTLRIYWQGLVRASHAEASTPITMAIKTYGAAAFEIEVLAETESAGEAAALERQFIEDHGSVIPGGYNAPFRAGQHAG